MSLAVKPLAVKLEMRAARSANGDGRLLLAALWLAVLASLRPSGTVHDVPPSCTHKKRVINLSKFWINLR